MYFNKERDKAVHRGRYNQLHRDKMRDKTIRQMWSSAAAQEPEMNKSAILSHTRQSPYQGIQRGALPVKYIADPSALPSAATVFIQLRKVWKEVG